MSERASDKALGLRIAECGCCYVVDRVALDALRAEADHSKCRAIGEWYGVPAYAWGEQ